MTETYRFPEAFYKVVLRGPAHTRSGYGEYVRGLATVLQQYDEFELTLQSTPWGNTPYIFDQNHPHQEMLQKLVEMTQQELQAGTKYDISFQVQLPHEWDPSIADFNIGVTAATEVDRVCEKWVESCNGMDLVIAMSEHTKRSLMNGPGEITTPIIVFGCPLKDEMLLDDVEPYPLELAPEVEDVFLHVGQLVGDVRRDRKNTFGLIWAFKEAFRDDPTKALVIKTNMGRNSAIDRIQCRNILRAFNAQNCAGSKARVYLLHGSLTDLQMSGLYRHPKMRAFVSYTRGEGFGLPFQEAACAGLPIIATNHSSYLEFLTTSGDAYFSRVDYIMNEVGDQYVDDVIIPKGARWAEVPPEAAVHALQRFDKKGLAKPKEWAAEAKEKVLKLFERSTMVEELFNKLVEAAPQAFDADYEEQGDEEVVQPAD